MTARVSSRTVWCPWCETILNRRALPVTTEAHCPTCRRVVQVAGRYRDLDGALVLVERTWLADWRIGQAAERARREVASETLRQLDRPASRRELAAG